MLFRPCSVRGSLRLFVGCCVFLLLCAADAQAADISLLPPSVSSALPNVVSRRADASSFSNVGFTEQMIADMLWASCGVNRPLDNGGRRTTNYSWNKRDTDVYLAAANGLFLYDAVEHKLVKKHGDDIRSLINPESINPAYVVIHVSNSSRLGSAGADYGAIHSAFCAENVLLYCTDRGLAISTSGTIPSGLKTAMGLDSTQDLIHVVQNVGYASGSSGHPDPWMVKEKHLINASVNSAIALKALKERRSTSSFSATELTLQQLSDLMWVGAGRIGSNGPLTYPMVSAQRHMDLYVVLPSGVYVYREATHVLEQISENDVRSGFGKAPAYGTLVYVSDVSKLGDVSAKTTFRSFHTGFMAQNVSAYCAENGIGHHIRSSKPDNLSTLLNLNSNQSAFIVQTIGIPSSAPGSSQVNVTAGSGGMVSGSSPQTIPYRGAGQSVSARPYPGYQFAYWSGLPGGRVTVVPLPLENVVCPMKITAVFEEAFPLNNPPVLDAVGDRSVRAGSEIQIGINATDPDGGDLDYTATGE